MSRMEIFLIVMLCAAPIIALLMVLPKIKFQKKTKKVDQPSKTYAELKAEENQDKKIEEPALEKQPNSNYEVSNDDIGSYLEYKKKNLTKPKRIEFPEDFRDRTMPYMPRRRAKQEKPKNIAQEIKSLSPKLRGLIVSGALNRKDVD